MKSTKDSIIDFEKEIEKLNKSIEEANKKTFIDIAWKIGEIAQNKVPLDTGYLRQSYTVLSLGKNRVESGYNTEYAYSIHEAMRESGTIINLRSGEKHFLTNSIMKNEANLLKFFQQRVEVYLSK